MVNVAALTVIKDEAPYITDWINHCFFMGFSEVYIAINRSCDDTKKVVKALSVNNKNIKVINDLINKRVIARSEKDFDAADKIRVKLLDMGIEIEDTKDKTIWRNIK